MFNRRFSLGVLGLLLLSFLMVFPAPAGAELKPCEGVASGTWDLPGAGSAAPGKAEGVFISFGFTLYKMEAELKPTNATATRGTIEGKLTSQQPFLPDASLRGVWELSPAGGGFKATITIPGFPDGWIRGRFVDPNPPGTPGRFKARFKVC